MRYPEGFKLRLLGSSLQSSGHDGAGATSQIATDTAHGLMRFVAWILGAEPGDQASLPVRVFYKFDSGAWRLGSTRQLHKVYRCR